MGAMTSPITGADGNVEFLVHLVAAPTSRQVHVHSADVVDVVVDEALTGRA